MNLSPDAIAALERAAVRAGDMRPLMTRTQRIARDRRRRMGRERIFVIDCSRRWGKTYFDAMTVHECAMEAPRRIIRYVAPSKVHGRQFVEPAFEWLFAQLPQAQRPKFIVQDNTWIWPNGSRCHLGSAETRRDCDAQVGTECHLAIVDEAGKIRSDLLEHLIVSVLGMQFLTTGGKILITSTPAETPAHALFNLVASAEQNGRLLRYTIDDCDHIPLEDRLFTIADSLQLGSDAARDDFIEKLRQCADTEARKALIQREGGPRHHVVLRELYCEHIDDPSRLIVPEWLVVGAACTREEPAAEYRDWYAAADFGFEDLTVVLYAWFDFDHQSIIVEHEVVLHHASSYEVGNACKALEASERIYNVSRVADAPLQLIADLAHRTLGPGIDFGMAQKDDADAALAQLRSEVGRSRIIVNPRCTTLLSHLRYGIWNERRSDFQRVDGFGHWDAIAALVYLNRTVERGANPAPILRPGQVPDNHHIPQHLRNHGRRTWTIGSDS